MRAARKRITVANVNKRYRINENFLKNTVIEILSEIKKTGKLKIAVVILGDRAIRKLNKRYLGEDRPTDVMSFRADGFADIFISSDTARSNSRFFGTGFEEELVLYAIHGILHLFGYDDGTKKDLARMSNAQNGILRRLCARRDLSKVLMRR